MNYYNKTILLVEDEPINAKLSKRTLEKYGYKVIHTKTGEEAVDVVQSNSGIDLILMDIDLGDGIDGTEAAELILENYNIPVVFLSSHTEPEIVEKTEGITSYGYIVKNSGETILLASMKMAFRLFDAGERDKDKEKKLREGEERYRSIFENTGTSMFLVERDMTISMINDEFVSRFGYSKDEVVGRMKWADIVHPDYYDFMKEQHRLRRENEKAAARSYELKYVTRAGEVRDAYISVAMMPDMDNSIASITDLTEQKKAEEAIKNKNQELAAINEEYEAANEELIQTIRQLDERDDEYRLLFESSSSGIFILSGGKFTMFNRAVADITGYSEDELMNKLPISFIHPDDIDLVTEHFNRILKKGEIETDSPLRILAADKIKWIGIKSISIQWEDKRATLNFISDITQRKEAEEAIKVAEETYRDLFMNSQIGLFRTDIDTGLILEANDCFARTFGFNGRDDLLSGYRSVSEWYVDPDIRGKIIGMLREHGEVINYEILLRRHDGPVIWIQISVRIFQENGWVQGVMEDITERKRVEDELSRRLIIESVISRISRMTSISDDIEHFLNMSLRIIGKTLKLSRSYIYNYSYETETMHNAFEWFSPGISPLKDEVRTFTVDRMPLLFNQLKRGLNFCFSDIEEIPEENTRYMIKSQNVLSILMVPLFVNGRYYGFIGFDDCVERHTWMEEDIELILSVSRIIAGFIERKIFEDNLRISEKKYRKIFENIQDVFYQTDMNGVITEISPSIERDSCFKREELIGRHVESVYIEPAERKRLVDTVLKKGQVIDYELRLKANDGRVIFVSTSSHIIPGSQGNPSGIEGTLHNITRRKKVEEQLENETKRLNGILVGTNAGTWEWNIQTGKTVFNDRWAEIMGYTLEEISPTSAKTWVKYLHPDDLEVSKKLLEKHFRGELDYYECELRAKHKNGSWVWVLARGKVINFDAEGRPLLMMGTRQDITKRKEAEEKIKEVNRSRTLYLAKLSHEIRTPLSGIIGMIDLAIMADSDTERLDCLNTIKQSSSHLVSIINDVIDFSKVESGALVLESAHFSPVQEIRNAISTFSYMSSTKGLYLNFDMKNISEDVTVLGDPTRFRQVIINLVGNAVKFTDKGGIDIIAGRLDEESIERSNILNIRIEVKDTGPGIGADRLDSIFVDFVQENGEISRKYGGYGLGLAISKELVELMGGSIRVQSEKGKGSNFILNIPFQIPEAEDKIKSSLPARRNFPDIKNMKYSILVAEDDMVNRKLIIALLKKQGHSVTVAENGEEVIKRLLKQNFDVILLDIEMPVMNGLEAAQLIRRGEAGEETAGVPIIALTAYVSADIKERCFNAGIDSCLSKPVKIAELNSLISDLIESGRNGKVIS